MKPKKSLGQNFLNNKDSLEAVVKAGQVREGQVVLEIGPGKGTLTSILLQRGAQVVAVEKDPNLVRFLQTKFEKEIKAGTLQVITKDILDFELACLKTRYKIIANIPYYITGALLRKVFSIPNLPSRTVLMLQKEVAQRIVANDKKESILSISVKAYGRPIYIRTVPAHEFSPAPKVDSAVLLIKEISKDYFKTLAEKNISEETFFKTIKTGFSQKRKTLANNLSSFGIDKKEIEKHTQSLGLPKSARAENLSIRDWEELLLLLHRGANKGSEK